MATIRSKLGRIKRHLVLNSRDLALRLNGSYQSEESVSLCTAVKDRLDHLIQSVTRNLEDNRDFPFLEIVILNYGCPNPDTERWVKRVLGPHIESGRVNYYYYPDKTTFKYAHARNLAYRLANGEILCNVDADNFTGTGFARFCSAQLRERNSFLTGPRDGRGVGGRIAIRREHFNLSGGYDERIIDWGADDYELSLRLERLKLKNRPIYKERFLHAIPHSDELRTRYSMSDDKWNTCDKSFQILELNRENDIINPNGENFGHGKVQRNFDQWITV